MIELDTTNARRIIDAQFPKYKRLSLEPIIPGGTDNTMFRLGQTLCARFPKREEAVPQIKKEQVWLPRLAPLPLKIPSEVGSGPASAEIPYDWSLYDWLPGKSLVESEIENWSAAAIALADFVLGLQAKDVSSAPLAGAQNHYRGVALEKRDELTIAAIAGLADEYSEEVLRRVWDEALQTPEHRGDPVWLHGDLQGGNILVSGGRLGAVIDFGLSGVGDPACDLMVAWSVLPRSARSVFKKSVRAADDTWMRGLGWALSVSVIALENYRGRNQPLSHISRQTIDAILDDL